MPEENKELGGKNCWRVLSGVVGEKINCRKMRVVSKKFTPDLNNLVSKLIHRHQASAPNVGPCTPLKRKKHVLIVEKQRWSKRKSKMALT